MGTITLTNSIDKNSPTYQRIEEEVDRMIAHGKAVKNGFITREGLIQFRLQQWQTYLECNTPARILFKLNTVLSSYIGAVVPVADQDDFCSRFLIETLRAFRREFAVENYTPKALLELAEFALFSQRYAQRRVPIVKMQTILLRAYTWKKQCERINEEIKYDGMLNEFGVPTYESFLDKNTASTNSLPATSTHDAQQLINSLFEYFQSIGQPELVRYLTLRTANLQVSDIDAVMGLTVRERDYIQQRFVYHVGQWMGTKGCDLYHEYFGINPANGLGLSGDQWAELKSQYHDIWSLKSRGVDDKSIGIRLGMSEGKVRREWRKMVQKAKVLRNGVRTVESYV
ncbi:MAG: hypothetical protein ACRC62_33875 [Microcoleus sp.]